MSIVIDKEKCICCGKCQKVCPGSLIKKDSNGYAYMKYKKDCWGCASCMKECEQGAIHFYLGAELGGNGGYMFTKREGDITHWVINRADGEKEIIDINRTESNNY